MIEHCMVSMHHPHSTDFDKREGHGTLLGKHLRASSCATWYDTAWHTDLTW
jgi:hypothetical protein